MKLAQRDEMKEKQRMKKEGIVSEYNDPDADGGVNEVDVDPGIDDDQFSSDGPVGGMAMEIG
jgi:transcription initiation factor TFIID subunit 7